MVNRGQHLPPCGSGSGWPWTCGIGDAWFDQAVADQVGCRVHCFDPTPRAIHFMESLADPRLVFYPIGIGGSDRTASFHLPRNEAHVSGSIVSAEHLGDASIEVCLETIETIRRRLGHRRIDVLKVDIEGAEYEVIEQMVHCGASRLVDQLLVEFHHRFPGIGTHSTRNAVRKLYKDGFRIAWISQSREEVLFVRV